MKTMATADFSGAASTAYDALTARLRKLHDLDAIEGLIQWDELTNMPDGAAEVRGRQKAALAELNHREATCKEHGDAITAAEEADAGQGCEWRAAVIRDARRDYNDAVRLPSALKAKEAELVGEPKTLFRALYSMHSIFKLLVFRVLTRTKLQPERSLAR